MNYLITMLIILQNYIKSQSFATFTDKIEDIIQPSTKKSEKKISKAMLMYLQRAKEHGNDRSILFVYIYFLT